MSPELDAKLCEEFPKIFRDRHGDMRTTAMCWGISTGDGWFDIIRLACFTIQQHIDNRLKNIDWALDWNERIQDENDDVFGKEPREVPEEIPQLVATQIKEKFGSLRFYYTGGDDYCDGVIDMADYLSSKICDVCGDKAIKQNTEGWIITRCEKHNAYS